MTSWNVDELVVDGQVEGTFDGKKVQAVLRRTENPEFRLITRGFHWINEYPFSR